MGEFIEVTRIYDNNTGEPDEMSIINANSILSVYQNGDSAIIERVGERFMVKETYAELKAMLMGKGDD